MKKIISLFKRDYDGNRQVIDEVVEGAEWVIAGEGIATQKYDGTCCLVRGGKLYKRYTLKPRKTAPAEFEPATEVDSVTGKQQGWVPVGDGPDDSHHREAFDRMPAEMKSQDRTCELIGPKIQGNPERYEDHCLVAHDFAEELVGAPRTFDELAEWFRDQDIEGIVWHHPDGRMVKIKKKDFGMKR